MIDIEARLRQTFSALAGNEALAEAVDENAAAVILKWGEEIAESFVRQTGDMEDEAADEFLSPYLNAMRKFLQAAGHWAVETDEAVRAEWWTRVEQNARVLFGDAVHLPAPENFPPDADTEQTMIFLKNFINEQGG
jgi:hypothetical protein